MRKVSTSFIGLTTALALAVVACGDDPTGDDPDVDSGSELTSTEVAAVLAAFNAAFESAVSGASAAPAQVPEEVDETFDNVSVPCESGNLVVSGSITGIADVETLVSDLTTTVSWDPNACVVGQGTNTFTVDGAPGVELVLHVTSTAQLAALTISGTETGGFSYTSSDGRSGTCGLDVTFSVATADTGVVRTVTGTICGLAADPFQTLGT
jgi:hypothetical protein